MERIAQCLHGSQSRKAVIIVSGLPRSGTSMMMLMLQSGGIPLLVDGVRSANESNPEGFFEFERVKRLTRGDVAWLDEARGRAVKIVSPLLDFVPDKYQCDIVFMLRDLNEVMASQRHMLGTDFSPADASDESEAIIRADYERHLYEVENRLQRRNNVRVHYVQHARVIQDPHGSALDIANFLGRRLDVTAMAAVVRLDLHRQRQSPEHSSQ